MSDTPALRASDADRDRTIGLLREHMAEGRLTLEEFTQRMSGASLARTCDELDELARDLPPPQARAAPRRRPTRLLLSVFGSTEREGRLRLPRRVACMTAFGNVDLDLRQATLEGDVITIFAVAAFAALDVYVPEGVEVDVHGLTAFGHKDAHGSDVEPLPGTPLVRVYAFGVFAGMDVWRVPLAWAKRTLGQVIKGIARGEHRELEP